MTELSVGSSLHLLLVLLTTFFTIILFLRTELIKRNIKSIEKVIIFSTVLLLLIRYYSYYTAGNYTWFIPLHLCNISMYLLLYYLVKKPKKLQQFLFLYSFFTIGALIYPSVDYDLSNPLLLTFFHDHIILFLVPFYLVIMEGYKPSYKNIKIPFITITIIVIISWPLNYLLNENFFYLTEKPLINLFLEVSDITFITLYCSVLYLGFSLITFIGKTVYKRHNKVTLSDVISY